MSEIVFVVIGSIAVIVVLIAIFWRKPKQHVPGPENNWQREPEKQSWTKDTNDLATVGISTDVGSDN